MQFDVFPGGPRFGISPASKMALSTMLNQRRGGQPGYMPPSSNPQQVDQGDVRVSTY